MICTGVRRQCVAACVLRAAADDELRPVCCGQHAMEWAAGPGAGIAACPVVEPAACGGLFCWWRWQRRYGASASALPGLPMSMTGTMLSAATAAISMYTASMPHREAMPPNSVGVRMLVTPRPKELTENMAS